MNARFAGLRGDRRRASAVVSQEVSYNPDGWWYVYLLDGAYLDAPLDPSLFPLTAGARMARTDVVAARIW